MSTYTTQQTIKCEIGEITVSTSPIEDPVRITVYNFDEMESAFLTIGQAWKLRDALTLLLDRGPG